MFIETLAVQKDWLYEHFKSFISYQYETFNTLKDPFYYAVLYARGDDEAEGRNRIGGRDGWTGLRGRGDRMDARLARRGGGLKREGGEFIATDGLVRFSISPLAPLIGPCNGGCCPRCAALRSTSIVV